MNNEEMAGRIMAHAFHNELEKIGGVGPLGGLRSLYQGTTRSKLRLRDRLGIPTPEAMYQKGFQRATDLEQVKSTKARERLKDAFRREAELERAQSNAARERLESQLLRLAERQPRSAVAAPPAPPRPSTAAEAYRAQLKRSRSARTRREGVKTPAGFGRYIK